LLKQFLVYYKRNNNKEDTMKSYTQFKNELAEDDMMQGEPGTEMPSTTIHYGPNDPEIVRTASITMTVPKYRLSEDEKGCNFTCSHWRDQTYCNEYKFKCDTDYTCDSWTDSGI